MNQGALLTVQIDLLTNTLSPQAREPLQWLAVLWCIRNCPVIIITFILTILISYFFNAHQHKATGVKIEAKQISNGCKQCFHSVTIVLWKETAFPLWRAMGRHWKRNVVFLVSSVTVVMCLLVSCVSSMAMSCHVPAVSMTNG